MYWLGRISGISGIFASVFMFFQKNSLLRGEWWWRFLFIVGLPVSGMTDTQKVVSFLDVFGRWDPVLFFVMASALFVTMIGYHLVLKRKSPVFDQLFSLPKRVLVDRNLVVGAVIFGTGWGLYGYCPGPAIAAMAYLNVDSFVFVVSMAVGMMLVNFFKSNARE